VREVLRTRKERAVALSLLAFGILAAAAQAIVVQEHNLRISVQGQVKPYRLPRTRPAPIAVFLSGHIDTPDGSSPRQLKKMTILVNRHGRLHDVGLPTCGLEEIRASTSQRALEQCGDALVGSGRFWASIVLPAQRPYPTRGRLLVFNGRAGGHPALYAHIFTTKPFASSFVVTFVLKRIHRGPWGTELTASLPQALGEWGYVDRIKLTLRRKYNYLGRLRSYFRASCPAPPGAKGAVFPLARTSFEFAERVQVTVPVTKSCGVAP
jgi:hypothetical protein